MLFAPDQCNGLAGFGDDFACFRVDHVQRDATSDDALFQVDYFLVAFFDWAHVDTTNGAAVEVADDNVLGDVNETAGQRIRSRLF